MLQAAYQVDSLAIVRNDAGDRLAMLGHDQSIGVQLVQQRQALFLELRGSNLFHCRPLCIDILYD